MAQFPRPDATVSAINFTGGFAEIDEAVASDVDFAWSANNTVGELIVALSDPGGIPGAGTTTYRYRIGKTNNGVLDGAGNAVTVTADLMQGAAVLATDAPRSATGAWTTYTWTPSTAGVTDWNDLRMRFTTSASGGNPSNRRGAGISWAELEVPDAGGLSLAIGVAASLTQALPLAGTQTGGIGIAAGSATAVALGGLLAGSIAPSTGADTAEPLGGRESGQIGAGLTSSLALGQSQGGTALAIGAAASLTQALPLAGTQAGGLGIAAGSDTAQPLSGRETGQIGAALTSSLALPLLQGGTALAIGAAGSLTQALPLAGTQAGGLGIAAGSHTAEPLGGLLVGSIGAAGSAAGALALTGRESGQIGTGLTSSLALPQSQGSAGQPLPSRVRPVRGRQVVRPVAARPNTVRAVGARRTVVAVRA